MTMNAMMIHQNFPTMLLRLTTIWVGKGRSTPMPANMLAKMGTTYLSSRPTTRLAMLMTETG